MERGEIVKSAATFILARSTKSEANIDLYQERIVRGMNSKIIGQLVLKKNKSKVFTKASFANEFTDAELAELYNVLKGKKPGSAKYELLDEVTKLELLTTLYRYAVKLAMVRS